MTCLVSGAMCLAVIRTLLSAVLPYRLLRMWVAVLLPLVLCACDSLASPSLVDSILGDSLNANDWLVNLRRELHAMPELGSAEFKTSAMVKKVLDELQIPYQDGYFGTGIMATISSGVPGPVVALRADIDALPVQEPEGLPFASTHPGAMHACGHDGHTSMLLGAARLLKAVEKQLPPGSVRLLFQPNEEFGAGGEHLVEEGALDGVSAVFGMHVAPWIPSGRLGVRAGTIMAGALSFLVTITGRGGHAAMPHLNVDPIVTAAAVMSGMQTLISRETSPLGSAVLSITLLRAGHAYNVIPDTAELGGTIRALSHESIVSLQQRLESLASGVAGGFGCNASVDWRLGEQPYYPPLVNDVSAMRFARGVAERVLGDDKVVEVEPIMAGEDFSFYCRKAPCNFAFLGIRNETLGSVHALHNPKFLLDEGVLHRGAALHAAWAIEHLATAHAQAQREAMHEEL